MKKIALLLALTFCTASVLKAQEYQQESNMIKGIIGKEKKDFVQAVVDIPAGTSDEFWTLYNDYETKRVSLGDKRVNLISRYVSTYNNPTPKEDNQLVSATCKLRKQSDNLIRSYYKKISHKVSPTTALQFFQVEEYLRTAVDNKIYDNLPMRQ